AVGAAVGAVFSAIGGRIAGAGPTLGARILRLGIRREVGGRPLGRSAGGGVLGSGGRPAIGTIGGGGGNPAGGRSLGGSVSRVGVGGPPGGVGAGLGLLGGERRFVGPVVGAAGLVGLHLHAELVLVVRQGCAGELGDALGGVGLAVVVGVGCVHEPLQRLRLAPGREQVVGVGVEQPRAPRLAPLRVELRDLQADDR